MADLHEQAAAAALAGIQGVAALKSQSSLLESGGPLHGIGRLLLYSRGKELKAARQQRDECHRLIAELLHAPPEDQKESVVMASMRGMVLATSTCKVMLGGICAYLSRHDAGQRLPLLRSLLDRLSQLEMPHAVPPVTAGEKRPLTESKDEEADGDDEEGREARKRGGGGGGGNVGASKKRRGGTTPLAGKAGGRDKAAPPAGPPVTTRAKAVHAAQWEAFLQALFDPVALAAIQALEDTACS